jgi:putative membrane protein
MSSLIHWIISAIAIGITAFLIPGATVGVLSAFVAAIVLGAINVFIKPVLILLTLPVNILTLGLFTFVINAMLIMLTSAIVPGFRVDGFLTALLFSLVLSIVNVVIFSIAE